MKTIFFKLPFRNKDNEWFFIGDRELIIAGSFASTMWLTYFASEVVWQILFADGWILTKILAILSLSVLSVSLMLLNYFLMHFFYFFVAGLVEKWRQGNG